MQEALSAMKNQLLQDNFEPGRLLRSLEYYYCQLMYSEYANHVHDHDHEDYNCNYLQYQSLDLELNFRVIIFGFTTLMIFFPLNLNRD